MLPEIAVAFLLSVAFFLLGRWHGQLDAERKRHENERAGYLIWSMVDAARSRCGLDGVPAEDGSASDLPDRLWDAWREAMDRIEVQQAIAESERADDNEADLEGNGVRVVARRDEGTE